MFFSMRRKYLLTWVFSLTTVLSYAQPPAKFEIGGGLGTLVYQGDLTKTFWGSTQFLKPSISGFIAYNINNKFSIRGSLTLGKIAMDETAYHDSTYRKLRALAFSTPISEFSAMLEWYPLTDGSASESRIIPYVFIGAGLSFVDINRDWSRFNTAAFAGTATATGLGQDTLHTLPHTVRVMPVGIGARYAITQALSIYAEGVYRFTFFDYLDGFKYAANPNTNDAYYGITVGVRYKLFKEGGVACPKTTGRRNTRI
jgi:hypothetical protein